LQTGESIAVNGVCLTAVAFTDDGFEADVSTETLSVTTLGRLTRGCRVNLEPALALGDRLGGHLVSGHVDGVGIVRQRVGDGRAVRFDVESPPDISRFIARKGSICIDGVSLTVNDVGENILSVAIIPHTLAQTVIGDYRPGTEVNIEVDMMARYVERLLGSDEGGGNSRDFLEAHGYG
jgi:riboflavin synthase